MPAGRTYIPIASTTLTTQTGVVSFTSIPAIYTDLVIQMSVQVNAASNNYIGFIRFNNDTGTNHSCTRIYGNSSTAGSDRVSTNASWIYTQSESSSNFVQTSINVMNYSNTTTNKTVLIRTGFAAGNTQATVGLWRSTAAINRIDLSPEDGRSGGYIAGSTFTLYGITAA